MQSQISKELYFKQFSLAEVLSLNVKNSSISNNSVLRNYSLVLFDPW